MAKISDLSGDERAQRVAELKAKMQAAAKQKQTEAGEEAPAAGQASAGTASAAEAAPTGAGEAVAATAEAVATVETTASGEVHADETAPAADGAAVDDASADEDAGAGETAAAVVATNGASANGASSVPVIEEKSEEEKLKAEMNRREFLTYAWGASLGMLALGGGVVSYFFMYPRFRAGEFGGAFFMGPESAVPPANAAPVGVTDGKFWWLSVEGEGPRAIYMVCTHLGCLYKWVGENNRFECPCHGSKFTREGDYIEGPAPRSLDLFVTTLENDEWVVDTGAKILGAPAAESPAAGTG